MSQINIMDIKKIIKDKQIKIEDMAKILNVSQSTISNNIKKIENGESSLKIIKKYFAILGYDVKIVVEKKDF